MSCDVCSDWRSSRLQEAEKVKLVQAKDRELAQAQQKLVEKVILVLNYMLYDHTYQPTNFNLLAMIINVAKYFYWKCTTTQKYAIHLVLTLWPLTLISLLQVPLLLADESDDVNAIFRSGIFISGKITMRLCNVSTGRVLQLIAMAISCVARARAQPKMWEFEILMRDSGMSCVFAGYSSKKRDGW